MTKIRAFLVNRHFGCLFVDVAKEERDKAEYEASNTDDHEITRGDTIPTLSMMPSLVTPTTTTTPAQSPEADSKTIPLL